MYLDIDYNPDEVPSFILHLPTWQRLMAAEVYHRSTENFAASEECVRSRKAVEKFWGGELDMPYPWKGRYSLMNAMSDFARMDFGRDVNFYIMDDPGGLDETWCGLGAGGLTEYEFLGMMRQLKEMLGDKHLGKLKIVFRKVREGRPTGMWAWCVRVYPKDFKIQPIWIVVDEWVAAIKEGF